MYAAIYGDRSRLTCFGSTFNPHPTHVHTHTHTPHGRAPRTGSRRYMTGEKNADPVKVGWTRSPRTLASRPVPSRPCPSCLTHPIRSPFNGYGLACGCGIVRLLQLAQQAVFAGWMSEESLCPCPCNRYSSAPSCQYTGARTHTIGTTAHACDSKSYTCVKVDAHILARARTHVFQHLLEGATYDGDRHR